MSRRGFVTTHRNPQTFRPSARFSMWARRGLGAFGARAQLLPLGNGSHQRPRCLFPNRGEMVETAVLGWADDPVDMD